MAKITLLALNEIKPDLFDGLKVPEGADKETLVNNILIKASDFEVIYPNPDFLKSEIALWSSKWNRTITKWWEALQIEYNPIENYDRYEEYTDTSHNASTSSTRDTSTASGSGSTTNTVSAYDSNDYQPHDRSQDSSSSQTSSNSSGDGTVDKEANHVAHIHGNIGVTTSSAMLAETLSMDIWNWYEHVTDLFLHDHVLPLYY